MFIGCTNFSSTDKTSKKVVCSTDSNSNKRDIDSTIWTRSKTFLPYSVDSNHNDKYDDYTVFPEFPGGELVLKRYIRQHINIPKEVRGRRIGITVIFRINSSGKATKVVSFGETYGCEDCKKSIKELISQLPLFEPGYYVNNKKHIKTPIAMNYDLDFEFFTDEEMTE